MSADGVLDDEVPLHVLVDHMPAVYSAQYKLSRCLLSLNRSQPSEADMRRLGSLRRSALVTVRQLQQAIDAHARKTGHASSEPVEQHVALSDEAQFFSQRVPEVCRTLEESIRESGLLLEHHVTNVMGSPFLPVSCIGTRIESVSPPIRSFPGEETAQRLAIFHDPEVYIAHTEKTTVERIGVAAAPPPKSTPATSGQSKKATMPAAAAVAAPSPHPTPAAQTPGSAEDEVLDDIKNVIGQMKQGALQMNTLMQRDVEALRTSEKLLQDGLRRSKRNIDSMDKLTGDSSSAYAAGGKGGRLLRHIPGGVFLWRSFLLPLWEVVKQAFYMCCILAATAFVVFVMLMMPKPKTFARKGSKGSSVPPQAPTAAPTAAPPATLVPHEPIVASSVELNSTLEHHVEPHGNVESASHSSGDGGAEEDEEGEDSYGSDYDDEEYEDEEDEEEAEEAEDEADTNTETFSAKETIPAEMNYDNADL